MEIAAKSCGRVALGAAQGPGIPGWDAPVQGVRGPGPKPLLQARGLDFVPPLPPPSVRNAEVRCSLGNLLRRTCPKVWLLEHLHQIHLAAG